MPGYRFCRPDDIPLLVQAVNDCAQSEVSAELGVLPSYPFWANTNWTVPLFKRAMREINLWPSSCMLAFGPDGVQPVAVSLGCKRKNGTLIYHIAAVASERRSGHAAHLLSSLSGKLAVLGPPLMSAEVSVENQAAIKLLEGLGYVQQALLTDLVFSGQMSVQGDQSCIGPLSVAEAESCGLLADSEHGSWFRDPIVLRQPPSGNVSGEIKGVAFASLDALEACLFYRVIEQDLLSQGNPGKCLEILYFQAADRTAKTMFFLVILRNIFAQEFASENGQVFIPRLAESELDFGLLYEHGFSQAGKYLCYQSTASEQ